MEQLCTWRVHQFCPGKEYDTGTFCTPSPIPPMTPEPRDCIAIELLREKHLQLIDKWRQIRSWDCLDNDHVDQRAQT